MKSDDKSDSQAHEQIVEIPHTEEVTNKELKIDHTRPVAEQSIEDSNVDPEPVEPPQPPLPPSGPSNLVPETPQTPAQIIPGQITPPIDPILGTAAALGSESTAPTSSGPVVSSENVAAVSQNSPQQPTASVETTQSTTKGRKIILILMAVLFAFGIIGGVVVLFISIINGAAKYSKSDLISTSAKHYSISHPKQWTDVSHNTKLLNKIGALDGGFDDLKAYAYQVNTTANTARSVVIAADQIDGISDTDLKAALTDPAAKQKFTAIIKPTITAHDVGCTSLSNKKNSVQYNNGNFIVKENISFDCVPAIDNGVKSPAEHDEGYFGIKNGYVYIIIISTLQTDWTKNATFYENTMLPSLTPR